METEARYDTAEAPLGLNGHEEEAVAEFDGIWCADLTPERVPFLAAGMEGWVEVRPMPEKAYNEYIRIQTGGGKMQVNLQGGDQRVEVDLDQQKLQMHLVAHCLIAACFPRKKAALNSPGDYVREETRLPEDERKRMEWIREKMTDANPRFWAWLVNHCMRVNGFTAAAQGN